MKITIEDIRRGGGCASGLRAFFNHYKLDLKGFLKRGYIESDELINTGDELAIQIVKRAIKYEQEW